MKASNGNGDARPELNGRSHRNKDKSLTEIIIEEPIACLAVAAAAGFILGGGARRASGLTILTMLGQLVVRETLGDTTLNDFISEA